MTTPQAPSMARRLRRLGCVWLLCLPLFSLLLWLVLDIRQAGLTLVDDVGLGTFWSRNIHSSPPSLEQLEQQMTDYYQHVQFALFISSGRQARLRGPPLAAVGPLHDLRTFQPLLTPREKASLLLTLHTVTAACRRHGLAFFLLGSSLVGSLRHHGLIPWSDVSVTLAMREKDKAVLLSLLEDIRELNAMWSNPYRWSVHLTDFFPDPPSLTRLTFVVIHFYQQNTTHIWADSWAGRRLFTVPRRKVFPLNARPFEGLLLPAPCDASSVLGSRDLTECRAVMEDEQEMEFHDVGPLPCEVLSRVFPFVMRRLPLTSHFMLEQVFVNGILLDSEEVDNGCAADSVPITE